MINGIHHVAIICSDYETSKSFYTQTLGLRILAENPQPLRDSIKLDLKLADNTQIELFCFKNAPKRPSYPEAQGLRHLALATDNLDDLKADLESKNIEVQDIRIDEYTGNRFMFIHDPDGLPIEFYETKSL